MSMERMLDAYEGLVGFSRGISTIKETCSSLVRELMQKHTELAEREKKIKQTEEELRAKKQALEEERYDRHLHPYSIARSCPCPSTGEISAVVSISLQRHAEGRPH